MMRKVLVFFALAFFLVPHCVLGGEDGFTKQDRELLLTLRVKLEEVDKRFEQVDKRIAELREDMNKRFELVDKRIAELREDMNKHIAELREDMNKRFEQVDKRFEQVDRRFEQLMNFLWILTAIFTTIMGAVIGFAYWDRRTIIRKAVDESAARIEAKGPVREILNALRDLARMNPDVMKVLRDHHLL
ncbi:MAG: hypothetical protein K6360_02600 [Deltaproteobacteria bacterium]